MTASESRRLMVEGSREQPSSWRVPFFWVGMWLTSVAIATGLVSSVVLFVRSSSTPRQADIDGWQWGSRDRKLAELRETFSGKRPVIVDPRQAEIESFLKEVTARTVGDAEAKWLQMLDVDRFRNRFLSSPWVASMSLIDRRALMSQDINALTIEGPNQFHKIEIIRIVPWAQVGGVSSRADETLVFTLAHQGYQDGEPVLFWLREIAGQWKLVDWEIVDGGSSESEWAGIWEFVTRDKLHPSCQISHNYLLRADALPYQDEAEYEKLLRLTEECRVPAPVEDLLRYKILNRWSLRSRHDEVLRLAKQVRDPEHIPGILLVHAKACQRLGETDAALALADRLEHLIGFRPDVAEFRAQLLKRSHRLEEALTEWRRLADFEPDRVSYLTELYRLLPKSERNTVIERIKLQKEPGTVALQFAWQNSDRMAPAMLQDLSQFVKNAAPNSSEARELEVLRLRKNFQYRAAAALYREAAEREEDSEERQRLWGSYLREMNMAGELLAGFAEHPDQKSALQEIVNGTDDDDLTIPVDDLIPLLAVYREKHPNDPWLLYCEGYVAFDQNRFADADKSFAESERLVSEQMKAGEKSPPGTPTRQAGRPSHETPDEGNADGDNLEELIGLTRRQRCRVRYELGEDVDVLVEYQHDEAAYQSLANLALQYGHWPVLERLNRAYASVKPDDQWLLFYETRALLAAKKFVAVREKLQVMARRESKIPLLKYWREQLERELFTAQHSDPMDAHRLSQDRSAAFNQLSNKLLVDRNWTVLEKLCDQQSAGGNDPSANFARLEMAWRRSDDAKLVQLLIPWPTSTIARQQYLESTWRERLIESLLQLQRWDEAHEKAKDANQRFGEAWPLIMTYVARRNAEGITQLLNDDESLVEEWSGKDFAANSHLRPVLMDDAFSDLRKQRHFAMPDYQAGEALLLFLREPMELSESWLLNRLTDPKNSAESAPKISQVSATTFVIHWKGMRFAVAAVAEPYFTPEFLNGPAFANRPHDGMASLFDQQRAHLRLIPLIADDPQLWDSSSTMVRELGARLLNPDVVGAMHIPKFSSLNHVVTLNDRLSDLLASRVPFPQLGTSTMTLRGDQTSKRLSTEKRRTLENLAELPQPLDDSVQVEVELQLCDSDIPMTAPFRVLEVRRRRYGGYQLVVEYVGKEHFPGFPELHAGIQYVVPLDHVASVSTPKMEPPVGK